jgi:hypothetical protein
VKKYSYRCVTCVFAIIFTSLFSIQASAKNDNPSDLAKPAQANTKQVTINTDEKLSDEELTDEKRADEELADEELADEELALLADDSNINISFANKSLQVEFADSFEERALGLMYRKGLCEDCGMLFQFDVERMASIWMKNTFVPLDLAYITVDGNIIDIMQLKPHDLTSIKSSKQVLYALEMNQGWFAKNNIKVGDKISIEGRVKQASFK